MTEDETDLLILKTLAAAYGELEGLRSIGPVSKEKKGNFQCPITVANRRKIKISSIISVVIGKQELSIKLEIRKSPEILFFNCPGEESSPLPAPIPPSGPLLGGDAVWHNAKPTWWGALAFTAQRIQIKNNAGQICSVGNACLSAN